MARTQCHTFNFLRWSKVQNGHTLKIQSNIPQTVLALRGSGGIKGGLVKGSGHQGSTGHDRTRKSIEFLSFFKKNGAGVRVLRSVAPFFYECFS